MKAAVAAIVLFCGLFVGVLAVYAGGALNSQMDSQTNSPLSEIKQQLKLIQNMLPRAAQVSELQGAPLAADVYNEAGQIIGYAFFTDDVVSIPAYSGQPIHTLVVFDLSGKFSGVQIISHKEPILVVGISNQRLEAFTRQYKGKNISDHIKIGGTDRPGYRSIDAISGATITVIVLNSSVTRSVIEVAKSRGLLKDSNQAGAANNEKIEPMWVSVWRSRIFEIIVLLIGLSILMFILILQDWLARHPSFLKRVRTAYLVYTVVFIGWYCLAQLSIVNVFTFIKAFVSGFQWDGFLIEPIMFILWGFVAITLLLWGRGVYCGWLCPFGALQELVFRLGEKMGVKSFEFPEVVHERLWAIKYIIMLLLFALSMQSITEMQKMAEVEPFKTVFTLRFQREWSYVVYALALILISAFNRKFYCRYICPLGASLTFSGRFKIFDWLRRRKECGRPCQTCRKDCEVRAIRSTGEIIDTECHYCLDCQITYWDDQRCLPLIERRRKHKKKSQINIAVDSLKKSKDIHQESQREKQRKKN
ncbi:Nitrous oxide reductase maturation protein NosR [hydrothermal vent metagenome]|uniref:Nitrous oxide reductase maturation protein NosR n=1 Tax=hydrothermal vent metagenome TaxID=652676 RepID=A0A3B0Y2G9_9ZZZZ